MQIGLVYFAFRIDDDSFAADASAGQMTRTSRSSRAPAPAPWRTPASRGRAEQANHGDGDPGLGGNLISRTPWKAQPQTRSTPRC